jgi:hypothetical protein
MYNYKRDLVDWLTLSQRLERPHMAICRLENQKCCSIQATESLRTRERTTGTSIPRLKAKDPGELLVQVYIQMLKNLEA